MTARTPQPLAAAVAPEPGRAQLPERLPLSFALDADHEAHEPPEARGTPRDQVRLLVSRGTDEPQHTRFDHLAAHLEPGDLVVANTSATVSSRPKKNRSDPASNADRPG